MTAPGTFSNKTSAKQGDIVRNPQQHHLVLTGANGEPVVTSENHPTPEGSKESLEVIVRTVLVATNSVLADMERDPIDAALEVPDLVEKVTEHLWDQQ
jgi:hypothetical protein